MVYKFTHPSLSRPFILVRVTDGQAIPGKVGEHPGWDAKNTLLLFIIIVTAYYCRILFTV